jgi:hypothetical protein
MNIFCSGEPGNIKALKAMHDKKTLVGKLRPPRNPSYPNILPVSTSLIT